ncbi:MAG: hypothetical protein ACYC3L_15910 [Gemmatimonadaceae bacterium]
MIAGNVSRSAGQMLVAAVAIVFGLATIWAGGAVLAGRDPGYVVYRPLLIFNTVMGVAYVVAGVQARRRALSGRNAAAVILVLNALVLGGVIYLYRTGTAVAVDSVRAMSFRSGVWLMLLLALAWMSRTRRGAA